MPEKDSHKTPSHPIFFPLQLFAKNTFIAVIPIALAVESWFFFRAIDSLAGPGAGARFLAAEKLVRFSISLKLLLLGINLGALLISAPLLVRSRAGDPGALGAFKSLLARGLASLGLTSASILLNGAFVGATLFVVFQFLKTVPPGFSSNALIFLLVFVAFLLSAMALLRTILFPFVVLSSEMSLRQALATASYLVDCQLSRIAAVVGLGLFTGFFGSVVIDHLPLLGQSPALRLILFLALTWYFALALAALCYQSLSDISTAHISTIRGMLAKKQVIIVEPAELPPEPTPPKKGRRKKATTALSRSEIEQLFMIDNGDPK